jgi:murein DD-endopeptidase MepM/ murein hydrolase activator NlpD
MDTQLITRPPVSGPKVEPKITKIDSLVLISRDTKKSSDKLRKIFEKGTYQKNTQLKILSRYKKKLDRIEKQEEDRRKKQKSKSKFTLPKIKQFKGSFFDPKSSDNPLKAIGLLAAFNAIDKTIQKDFSGAIGPALVAGGIFFGPKLLSLAASRFMGGKPTGTPASSTTSKVPWWQNNTKSLSRSNESYSRFISKEANIGDKARLVRRGLITPRQALTKGGSEALSTASQGGRVAKAFGKFGSSIIPGVGAVVGAADATLRAQAGDVTGSAIAGTAAGLDAFAAASAATGFGLPLAGLASIASFALDLTNLVRDLSGMSAAEEVKNKDKLKEQTKEQKKLVEKQKEERQQLTFSKTLNSYDKAIRKFEDFSKNFKFGMGVGDPQNPYNEPVQYPAPRDNGQDYEGPVSGDTFWPLPNGTIGQAGQEYGASRDGGKRDHLGQDFAGPAINPNGGDPVVAWKTGKVIGTTPAGYYGDVYVDHGNGERTRYLHVSPEVKEGDIVYGGQRIASLYPLGQNTHLHFEQYKNRQIMNPVDAGLGQKIGAPLDRARAEKLHREKTDPSQNQGGQPQPKPQSRNFGVEFNMNNNTFTKAGLFGNQLIKVTDQENAWLRQIPNFGLNVGTKVGEIKMAHDGKSYKWTGSKWVYYDHLRETAGQTYPGRGSDFETVTVIDPPPSKVRNIERNLSYQEQYSDPEPIIVPFVVPQRQRSQMQEPQIQSDSMMYSGPSETDLLNNFYKKVLLNTLQ